MPGLAQRVRSEEILVDGVRVFVRRTDGDGVPVVFVHGHPTSSQDWLPFMERVEGPAIALDLPGWGRSERPGRERLETTMHGLAGFLERFYDALGVGECRLVCHDWGVVSLIAAQSHPERVSRLVIMNAVPLLPGYRWHWMAPAGVASPRNRRAGEPHLQPPRAGAPLPPSERHPRVDARRVPRPGLGGVDSWHLAAGPRPLPLGAPPRARRVRRGPRPHHLSGAVAWGTGDPFLPTRFGRTYAERLPAAELLEIPEAGHWPWIDQPSVIDSVCEFV